MSGLNIDGLIDRSQQMATSNMDSLLQMAQSIDNDSPGDALKMELQMKKVEAGLELTAALIKSFGDITKSITQRM